MQRLNLAELLHAHDDLVVGLPLDAGDREQILDNHNDGVPGQLPPKPELGVAVMDQLEGLKVSLEGGGGHLVDEAI